MKQLKQILFITLLFLNAGIQAQVKIGNNPTTIGTSSSLELESTNKALLITRVANTAAITTPVNGMLIYDLSSNCIKSYENGVWTNCLSNGSNIEPSSNGSAVVASYSCNTASTGTLTAGQIASGATQTITANVTAIGSYTITAIANGIIFSGSGFFNATGNQNVTLSATGTPINTGSTNFVLNTTPNCNFSRTVLTNPSTNGSAVVSTYSCATASAGTMLEGATVSGVTQTITATVTTIGTYNISTTANGVTFAGSGTFTATGPQAVVLSATGTPTVAGSNTFTLNTTPNCNFIRFVLYKSTNGTANVSAYNCSGTSIGVMNVGTAVSGVTQVVTATVTTAGSYNISTTANGVTFAGSGTFASTGSQNITLTATGTPVAAGTNNFPLNTTPNCSFTRSTGEPFTSTVCATSIGTFPSTVTVGSTSVTVSKTTTTDDGSITSLAQCGLFASGNLLNLNATSQSATYTFSVPLKNVQIYALNNESVENNEGLTVTASLAGVAVPVQLSPFGGSCLANFTTSQSGNTASFQNTVSSSAMGAIINVSASGPYDRLIVTRTSSASGNNSHGLMFCNATAVPNLTSGGSAVVSAYNCSGTSIGTMTQGTAVGGVTQTITATVTTAGGYNISATANGVTFTGSGTFAGTGSQTITLTATGTPTAAGQHTFSLSTSPSCSFNRSTGSTFANTVCTTGYGSYPQTLTIGGNSVTIAKITSTDGGFSANVSQCGISITGNSLKLNSGQSATYTFSSSLNNVQVYGLNNEVSEATEGFTVTATKAGVSVPVQLVPTSAGTCNSSFTSSQSGNSASINMTSGGTATQGLIFNISSSVGYDRVVITRVVAAGNNEHSLLFCNASLAP